MGLIKLIFKIIFSRITLAFLALVLQLAVIFLSLFVFKEYLLYFIIGFTIINIIVSCCILNKEENPTYKIVWLSVIYIFPVFGVSLYLLLHIQPGHTKISKKLNRLHQQSKSYLIQNGEVINKLGRDNLDVLNFSNYMFKAGAFPIYDKTGAKYLSSGEEFLEDLLVELSKAKKYIFLEYFIIEKGIMWNRVLEVLKEKAREGVEVRILYDGMCSIVLLPYNYPKQMEEFGLKCKIIFPLKPIFSTHQNNRDHRKTCVIDGKVAYTGGINFSDEYINVKKKYGHWKDTAVRIEGPAVDTFTLLFLEMWNLDEETVELGEEYLFGRTSFKNNQMGYVLPYADSPLDKEDISKNVYLEMIKTAKKSIYIMTPYLVLDYEFLNNLIYSAKKGIDVKIIMPNIPDKKMVYYIGRSYYFDLIEAGVEIYEYTPGFPHAKVLISDSERASVGSVNIDYRSFYLHFENGIYFYKGEVIKQIEDDFQETLKKSNKITKEDVLNYPLWKKVFGRILRIFSPLV